MKGPSSWPKPLDADSHAAETSRVMEDRIIRFGPAKPQPNWYARTHRVPLFLRVSFVIEH